MHFSDFIRHLQSLADEFGDVDPEVKIAMQENYPIEARVREITGCEGSDPDDQARAELPTSWKGLQ